MKNWSLLQGTKIVIEKMGHTRNDFGDGGKFYALILAQKLKYCPTIKKYGIVIAS